MSIKDHVNDAGLYTLSQASAMIGRHPDTIRRWVRSGTVPPPKEMAFGDISVWVYSPADVDALQQVANNMRVGRPPVGLTPVARDPKTLKLVSVYRKRK